MSNNTVKKTFQIETSEAVMQRIERFFALLHHNSNFGHSATFAMPLDGDGWDKVKVIPLPGFAREVDLIGGVGGSIEIAYDNSYSVTNPKPLSSDWVVKDGALYKNGEKYKS